MSFTKKLSFSALIRPVQDKAVNSLFTSSKQIHYINYSVLITRRCSTQPECQNKSYVVNSKYDLEDAKKLEELLEDPKTLILYEKLKLEVEHIRHTDGYVPEKLKHRDWILLLSITSKGQRRGYLEYRWKIQRKVENRLVKKLQKQKEREKLFEIQSKMESDHIVYGLNHNSMFIRISDSKMNHFYNSKLIPAMMFEPTVVFDVGYDKFMSPHEAMNCAKQLILSYSANRIHIDPFNLYFCNCDKSGILMKHFHKTVPTLHDLDFPINMTEQSYLNVFDKNKLIYLTANAKKVLHKFDPNMVYIIGAMVDKYDPQPLSFAKAKKEGLPMARLPLAEHLEWGTGSGKNLPINQVLQILLDLRHTNDWAVALEHIPKRKLKQARIDAQERLEKKRAEIIQLLQNQ
ncbi:Mitochondrial ribonuclease P protein 1 like protein [Dufourea novaeangliae]|uniref:RNA (guanine-9-)-methyltransferase domain-containing protein 1 n=2 Tax=Dufourea novaeangliae TaxID=178035 RepID=A0A154P1V2_DUFNO|nr:Mitochondrial ribonuclease P protein 1 like protein [Dufourea novaeangliae]